MLEQGGPLPTVTGFGPTTPGYLDDPYVALRELRERLPVCRDAETGLAYLFGFEDVAAGLTEITRNTDERRVHFPNNPFAADGPAHSRPRRVIMPALVNRAVQRYRDRAQAIVDAALDATGPDGRLEVVEQIGFPLPYHLTCDLLGVPEVGNAAELRAWTWQSLELIDAFLSPEQLQQNLQASAHLAEHLREVVAWKRDHLADDVLSAVILAADEGEVMKPEQVVSYVHTLYLAGMHTTVNQTALSLLTLMRHRSQWELLVADPALVDGAVEELLRYEPTAQYMRRTCARDYPVGDFVIPAGTEVVCWIASANRDAARWGPTADIFDIRREDAHQHIAFGKGPHVCVGSWLARLELQVVLSSLTRRFPRTELPDQELVWASNVIRGPEELVLHLAA